MFLVLYCTGMRVSEVCQLKPNCLEHVERGYFITYYSTKMKKEVMNVIPENLYNILQLKRDSIKDIVQNFLFVGKDGSAFRSGTFRPYMQRELENFNIKNPDGTVYVYKPHSYRHSIAKKMRELEIPFQYIQEQLHHLSPEMTMNYVEFMDKEKVEKMNSFININGDVSPIKIDVKLDNDEAFAEYMRDFINAQILPNGVCSRPVKLGNCPHCNSCLTCSDFRTSIDNLSTHKEQLTRVEQYLEIAIKNNWEPQIATNELTRENLIKMINKLEATLTPGGNK